MLPRIKDGQTHQKAASILSSALKGKANLSGRDLISAFSRRAKVTERRE